MPLNKGRYEKQALLDIQYLNGMSIKPLGNTVSRTANSSGFPTETGNIVNEMKATPSLPINEEPDYTGIGYDPGFLRTNHYGVCIALMVFFTLTSLVVGIFLFAYLMIDASANHQSMPVATHQDDD